MALWTGSAFFVPDERRLTLVGDADCFQLLGVETGLFERRQHHSLRVLPDFVGVVFDPAGLRVNLFVHLVGIRNDLAAAVEHPERRVVP